MKKIVLTISIFTFIFAFVLLAAYFVFAVNPVSRESSLKEVEISQGAGFGQIASILESAGVIRSSSVFEALALFSGSAHKLKPGTYLLDAGLSAADILKAVVSGPELEKEVVVPEGFTLLDIDRRLSESGVLGAGALAKFDASIFKNDYEFLKNLKSPVKLEGYLFPDTYKFYIKSKPEDVVKKFLDNFNQKAWFLLKEQSRTAGKEVLGPAQLLAIASLVEKEVYFDKDRPIVAGIIYKRLKMGMALQIDASISYAKCGGYIFYCESPAISKEETKFKSLYNTYLYKGLPPGPIGNPGLKSIDAALNPQTSEFLYYLSDPDTHEIIFSKNLDEHNDNRAEYL